MPCCENCWDFLRRLLQRPDRLPFVVAGETHIAPGHHNHLMSQQFLDGWEIDAVHDHPTGKDMPEIMERQVC
jgi:hypothetical protein